MTADASWLSASAISGRNSTGGPASNQTFAEPIMTYSENPRYDLDASGMALVKTYVSGHGTTCPGLTWEPKAAFRAVAGYYARDPASAIPGE